MLVTTVIGVGDHITWRPKVAVPVKGASSFISTLCPNEQSRTELVTPLPADDNLTRKQRSKCWFACFRDAHARQRNVGRTSNDLTFHSFRHPAVSLMKTPGISEGVVMELIGDESKAISDHVPSLAMKAQKGRCRTAVDLNNPMPKTKSSKVEDPIGDALQSGFADADEGFFSEDNDEAP
jgi:hypothetical protein